MKIHSISPRSATLLVLFCTISLFAVSTPAQAAQAPWESAYSADPFAGGVIRGVFCEIMGLMEGSLGGLLLSAAIVLAIGGAAFGDFTSAKTSMVVGLSAVTLAAGVSLYFGDMGCGGGEGGGGGAAADGGGGAPGGGGNENPFDFP